MKMFSREQQFELMFTIEKIDESIKAMMEAERKQKEERRKRIEAWIKQREADHKAFVREYEKWKSKRESK